MSSTTEEVNHQKGVNEQTGANHQTGVNEQTEMVMETSNQTGTGVNEQTEVVMQETSNQIGVDGQTEVVMGETSKHMASTQHEEEVIKKKYGGIVPKKPPLISKDNERAYFDSADWALGKQGKDKPKGPLEALRPKLQPTQQQTRYRKSPYAPSEGEDGDTARPEDATTNE